MASVKKITMHEYNGTDYDTLYPKTIASQVDGVYNKTEVDALLASKLGGIESTDYPGCYYRMVSGVTEWFNPPVQLNVEYRTTERYMGKPVYIKLVDFGALPNNTFKTVYITESEKTIPIWFEGKLDTHNQVMRDGFLPANNGSGGNYLITTCSFTGNEIGGIFVKTTMDMTGFTAKVLVKYIKMAD